METTPTTVEKKSHSRMSWGQYVAIACLSVALFFLGVYFGSTDKFLGHTLNLNRLFPSSTPQMAAEERPSLEEFWNVWQLLDQKFISASSSKVVTDEERLQGAISGLVDAYGDPYTMYLSPQDADQFGDDIAGNFSGVGMEVGIRDGVITVISPLPGTPAEKAGLISGDAIVRIDGKTTEGMRIDEAVKIIRGEKGTVVEFSIFREGDTEFRTISVTRDTIDIPTVKTEKIDNTFIISLYSFNAVAESKMQEAIEQFVASRADQLIIDVRGNPGGFLQSAVDIASFFLPPGQVVVREQAGVTGEDKVFRSRNRQVRDFTPKDLVVLVDNGSASASEILAGALHDHAVATIIGGQTFGKGSVQELVDLEDGSSLKVTVARWFTPNGVSISDSGLTPDIMIKRTADDREANRDPQKDAALRFLHGEEVKSEVFADEFKKLETGG
jgi:carboxyl-terminal processing protease